MSVRTAIVVTVALVSQVANVPMAGATEDVAIPGHSDIPARELAAYSGTWRQRVLRDGAWIDAATITEEMAPDTLDGDSVYRHRQEMRIKDGRVVEAISLFKAPSLEPLSASVRFVGFPEGAPTAREVVFTPEAITVATILPSGNNESVLPTTAPMYNGSLLGLVIAALPLAQDYRIRVPAAMPSMQLSYWMTLTVAGQSTVQVQRKPRSVWRVDAEWLNLHDGGIYPGGPEGSGGSYFVFVDPMPGEPPVYRYVNENVDIIYDPAR